MVKNGCDELVTAANAGDAGAACRLGDLYRSGLDFPADEQEAIRWYVKATLLGSLMGRCWLDLLLRRNSFVSQPANSILKEVMELADKGEPAACCIYGMILRAGWRCKKDYSQALDYFRKGASLEHPGCINNLGLMYGSGLGVCKDILAATECYRQAAEMGDGSAQSNLSQMYHEGCGVNKDWMLAVSWYRKAISQGLLKAYEHLQKMYYMKLLRQEYPRETVEWLQEAAANGDAAAQFSLGDLYQSGNMVPKDLTRSFSYYLSAAEQGNVYAQSKLATMHGNGWGTKKDLGLEYKWGKMAAEQWVMEAVGTVAWQYSGGFHGPNKQKLAYHLYRIYSDLRQNGIPSLHTIILKKGIKLLSQKNYGGAVDLFKQMKTKNSPVQADIASPVHRGVLEEWNGCYAKAIALQREGKPLQALEFARESLNIAETCLERDHVDTAASLNLLGELFMTMQVVEPALELFRRALAIRVRRLGRWHYEVSEAVHNIAACPSDLAISSFDERAESRVKLSELALAIRVRVFGTSHPSVAFSFNHLAACYFNEGDFKKSLLYAKKAVAMYTKELGANHEMTVYVKNQKYYFQQESQEIEELRIKEEEDPFDPNTDNYFERYSRRSPGKKSDSTEN